MKLQLVERNPLNFSVWPVILVTALQITPLATTSLSFYQIGLTASTSLLFRALLETRASQDANEKLGLSTFQIESYHWPVQPLVERERLCEWERSNTTLSRDTYLVSFNISASRARQQQSAAVKQMKYIQNRAGAQFWHLALEVCRKMSLELQGNDERVGKTRDEQETRRLTLSTIDESSSQEKSYDTTVCLQPGKQEDSKPYDIIIFGASGSVGKFLVEEMALVVEKYYSDKQHPPMASSNDIREIRDPIQFAQTNTRRQSVPRRSAGLRWAVAGRSASRLSDCLCRAQLSTGIKDLSTRVPVLLADLNHDRSLLELCSKTKLVLNCVGPYSLGAELLIKACIEKGTNYMDLCHESTFIEWIRQEYSDAARAAQVYIINGCGFQSMSAEMGLNFAKQVVDGQIDEMKIIFKLNDSQAIIKSPGERPNETSGIISTGMWNSLLTEREQELHLAPKSSGKRPKRKNLAPHEPGNIDNDSQRRQLLRQDTQSLVKNLVEFRNRESLAWLQLLRGFQEAGREFCLPISGLTSEETQLIHGEMSNYERRTPDVAEGCWRPVRCSSFISMQSLSQLILLSLWLLIFNLLVKFSPIRSLLRTFPKISTFGHVSSRNKGFQRDSLGHIKFCQTFIVYGTPGDNSGDPLTRREKNYRPKKEQLLVTRVVGPEPNHVATATYAIQAAIVLIMEGDHLPSGGGVLTPGAAFADTNIIYQLRRRNIKFEIMKKA